MALSASDYRSLEGRRLAILDRVSGVDVPVYGDWVDLDVKRRQVAEVGEYLESPGADPIAARGLVALLEAGWVWQLMPAGWRLGEVAPFVVPGATAAPPKTATPPKSPRTGTGAGVPAVAPPVVEAAAVPGSAPSWFGRQPMIVKVGLGVGVLGGLLWWVSRKPRKRSRG